MTRTPTHLGDGAYAQDDPSTPGGIIVTKINDLGDDGCDEIYLSKNEVAALLRWLDADPKAEIVAWLRGLDAGARAQGRHRDGGCYGFAADAIERGDYKPVSK